MPIILPWELWDFILEIAVAASVSPHEFCDHLNFPRIALHLQSPRKHALNSPWLCNLRLVCRTFNNLVASPYCFTMITKGQSEIKRWTRALYSGGYIGTRAYLKAFINEPWKSQRLVLLQMERYPLFQGGRDTPFNTLSRNSFTALSNVQTLILTSQRYTPSDASLVQLWTVLNDAFPLLHTLSIGATHLMATGGISRVTWDHLRIIDLDGTSVPWYVEFPALRHASFGWVSTADINGKLTKLRSLESLLCRNFYVSANTGFKWNAVPHLKLLGVPHPQIHNIPKPPSDHPLRHLRIHLESVPNYKRFSLPYMQPNRFEWLAKTLKQFPNVSRFTINLGWWQRPDIEWAKEGVDETKLTRLGIYIGHSADLSDRCRIIVIRRLPTETSTEPPSRSSSLVVRKWLTHRLHL